ncbi:MAG TPA: competence/damage-inducible protein A [Blastocatellia bacterium]|nr:competence/damage-inducible protein A [Blastocatellia bacterium]
MHIPTAAILVIGNEVLSGKIEEQNARFLIGELRALGVALKCILTIPDEPDEIAAAVRDLSARFDYVFTSGGVGPTHDDVTISSIAHAFDKPIVRHPELEAMLRGYFGDGIDETRLRMADVPEGAELVYGGEMRFPVIAYRNVFIFPGVPELFRKKFTAIRERFRVAPFYLRTVHTLEDEFDIAERLQTVADAHPAVAIGSYPNFASPEYRVKLTLESKIEAAVDSAHQALLLVLDETLIVEL